VAELKLLHDATSPRRHDQAAWGLSLSLVRLAARVACVVALYLGRSCSAAACMTRSMLNLRALLI
jgi:hypothetical protein